MNVFKKYNFLIFFFISTLVLAATAPSSFTNHMGPVSTNGGTSFRVWAPHANTVTLAGEFNSWNKNSTPFFRILLPINLVFDTEFTLDYAISVGLKDGSPTPTTAWIDFSKLNENSMDYWGEITDLGTSYGYLSNSFGQLALYNQSSAGDSLSVTGTFDTGFELSLNLSEIGGIADMCWVQAMIISSSGEYSANQSLRAIHNDTNSYAVGGAFSSKRYNLVSGEQFMVLGISEPGFGFCFRNRKY